ncbi:SUKH-3 domain-containing protein [Neorhodopirellula pilleata]|uniref:SUKH-3 domain-containing protein n=1 Tax=Neorhodopirellula pilleata TaxID=2714738 RepID=UPI0018CDE115|nr:SUKH-3 domain-containing protein [Neorhodopirellula pilleata]
MNFHISTRARLYFDLAGFNSDRVVPVDPCVPHGHPAHGLLARFGGLRIGVNEDNEMLSEIRNDIAFEPAERYGEIHEWERLLRTRLICVAETHHRHGLLYLSEDERFFNLSGQHDAMGFNPALFTKRAFRVETIA